VAPAARQSDTAERPLGRGPPRSRAKSPLGRGPPRSRAECPLGRGSPRSRAERPARSASLEVPCTRHPHSCSHVRAFNALTPQDCATTLTRLGIMPRRCSTAPLGETIPATIQHCAERPVSVPWHCAAYLRTANMSSSRSEDGGTLEWEPALFL
jgi:hypothetical protein